MADDFLVVGRGKSMEEALGAHDKNLLGFLRRCEERNLVVNRDKLLLRETKVPFIGHVASQEGLSADPAKIEAIMKMPAPTDKSGVQRLLGMVQYLSKFLPKLSDRTKPLRDLLQKDTAFWWGEAQEIALQSIKEAVSDTPVLRYYDLAEEVTIQCDASSFGLGAALLQKGQPVAFASRSLSQAETRYAQIEKELLAIVFACEHFEPYVFGREVVNVHTDHKPLEIIVKKPLHTAPKRLQRMLLRLQRYNLAVKYIKGKDMYLADALSRAPIRISANTWCKHQMEEYVSVSHLETLPVSNDRWAELRIETAKDTVLRDLQDVILEGWPQKKVDVRQHLQPYFDIRDELVTQDGLIFKGHQVVVPKSLRRSLLSKIHSSHIGTGGCIRKAREALYWPRMTTEIRDLVSKCDICLKYRNNQCKEPMIVQEFGDRPWERVAADLLEFDNRQLLVVTDYFSNFIEVSRLGKATSSTVIKELKVIFARFGIPDTLVTDNGPQFASAEFRKFANEWSLKHQTSSPHYPQANGKAENGVQTVKRLFLKCKESGQSEFLALLDWRNTPSEGMDSSPAQRLLGRRCRTLLPTSEALLKPRFEVKEDQMALQKRKEKQKRYFDRTARSLTPLSTGERIQMKLPGQDTWSSGVCVREAAPRSYWVKVNEREYRRNRRDIIQLPDQNSPEESDKDENPASVQEEEQSEKSCSSEQNKVTKTATQPIRRSTRETRRPSHLVNDYETEFYPKK